MVWRLIATLCLAYFAADLAMDIAPAPVASAVCRVAMEMPQQPFLDRVPTEVG